MTTTTKENQNADKHCADPNKRWTFDKEVTDSFSEMLTASIPDYRNMRSWVAALAADYLSRVHSPTATSAARWAMTGSVLDIGASRGDAVADLVEQFPNCRFHLVEISKPMVEVLNQRFASCENVRVVSEDLSEEPGCVRSTRAAGHHVALSVLTLMFVPIECRQRVLQAVYDSLAPGGMFVIVEKTLGETVTSQELLVSQYHAFKVRSGYTVENVERKRLSLKGSLIPTKPSWIEEMLRDAGFSDVTRFWQALQFVGWVAFKK
jgi:tRNA (cmo5U34)-methyltransferase